MKNLLLKEIFGRKIVIFFIVANIFICNAFNAIAFEKSPSLVTNIDVYEAPQIEGITKWLNSHPIKLSQLKGKVVLLDFWTYSCINCIRTLSSLNKLHEQYKDKGLIIIGVHSPEFEFEKEIVNVEKAVKKFGIEYPVALDNNLVTWHNYDNSYWPAHYLIDQGGKVVYTRFGEGQYDVLDNNIRSLLKLSQEPQKFDDPLQSLLFRHTTPETYLGAARVERNLNMDSDFVFPSTPIAVHYWALNGNWKINNEFIESEDKAAALRFRFMAKKVFIVMESADGEEINVDVKLDGKPIDVMAGEDVKNSSIAVRDSRLYEIINMPKAHEKLLEIKASRKGLRAYVFTFGS